MNLEMVRCETCGTLYLSDGVDDGKCFPCSRDRKEESALRRRSEERLKLARRD